MDVQFQASLAPKSLKHAKAASLCSASEAIIKPCGQRGSRPIMFCEFLAGFRFKPYSIGRFRPRAFVRVLGLSPESPAFSHSSR